MTINLTRIFAQVSNCDETDSDTCDTNLPQIELDANTLQEILQVLFGVIAAMTVIMIIYQAIMFTLSDGEPDKAGRARKAIIFALVGLAVSLLAEALVTFFLTDILK